MAPVSLHADTTAIRHALQVSPRVRNRQHEFLRYEKWRVLRWHLIPCCTSAWSRLVLLQQRGLVFMVPLSGFHHLPKSPLVQSAIDAGERYEEDVTLIWR